MRTLSALLLLTTVSACDPVSQQTVGLTVPTDDRQEPALTLDAPNQVASGRRALLEGTLTDPDQPANTLALTLTSDLQGELWRGNADVDGLWAWEGVLDDGLHLLSITATDESNVTVAAWATTYVGEVASSDRAPTCRITAPVATDVVSGSSVRLEADAHDDLTADDQLLVAWYRDAEGPFLFGYEGDYVFSGEGDTLLTLEVTDDSGNVCTDEMVLTLVQL